MVHYRLTFFEITGRAECPRLILHYAGQKFDDVRLKWDEWLKVKSQFPNELLPCLEVDGHKISQMGAITRHLARKFNLYPKEELEAARADELYEVFAQRFNEHLPYTLWAFGASPDADGDKLYKEQLVPTARKALDFYSKTIKASGSGFINASGVCFADFALAGHTRMLLIWAPELEKDYPEVAAHRDRIYALPQFKEYLKTQPKI